MSDMTDLVIRARPPRGKGLRSRAAKARKRELSPYPNRQRPKETPRDQPDT